MVLVVLVGLELVHSLMEGTYILVKGRWVPSEMALVEFWEECILAMVVNLDLVARSGRKVSIVFDPIYATEKRSHVTTNGGMRMVLTETRKPHRLLKVIKLHRELLKGESCKAGWYIYQYRLKIKIKIKI